MSREPIPTWFFAIVVVRLGHRFLLVLETGDAPEWYLPAGRVLPRESLVEAAQRETLEETGIPIVVEGILRIEHSPELDGTARCRAIFVGRPADDTPPKGIADEHSVRAAWVTLDELQYLPLRGEEVRAILHHVAGGGAVYPVGLLAPEGAPFVG